MQLEDYVRQVHDQLTAAAALADDRTREIAARLADTAAPALRLAIMNALAAAADEITAALLDSPGSPAVAVRVEGADVRIDVAAGAPEPAAPRPDEGDANARISLRLSEALKAEVEEAAAHDGVSVNTWLVRAASHALAGPWGGFDGRHAGAGRTASRNVRSRNAHHVTGWING